MDKLGERQIEKPTLYHQTLQLTEEQPCFVLSVSSSSYDNLLPKHHPGNSRPEEGDELHGSRRETHHSPLGEGRQDH